MSLGGDTADVRSDERLDCARLSSYLRGKVDGAEGPLDVEQFPGGHSNLTYLLRFGDREFVLRRPPLGPIAPKAHDVAREHRVLSALAGVFPPAPRVYHLCQDPSIIGAPFFVMERRRGVVIRRHMPPELGDAPDTCRRVSEALVDTLADLHAIDYHAVGLGDLGKPERFVERQVRGWAERWQRAKTREMPEIEQIEKWLLERIPPSPPPTILHNDYKLDNTMYDAGDPSRIVAIFDWEMCTTGDPLVDLGTLLGYWVEEGDPPVLTGSLTAPTTLPGFLKRSEIVERYGRKTGRDLSHVAFYQVFAYYKTAVVVEQIYVRYVRGQTKDERFAAIGAGVPLLVDAARELAAKSGL